MSAPEQRAPIKRRYERITVMWSGTITVGRCAIGCIIRNISAGGATLQVETPIVVSSVAVTLETNRIGTLRSKVVWHQGDLVGLRFLEKPQKVARALGITIP
jgi:PilZ domain